jgi:hypothetical protein
VVSFDTSPQANWHFNHTTPPLGNTIDFYSVAVHELAHALGFGSIDPDPQSVSPWEAQISGGFFQGANARAQKNGNPVPLSADLAHWANGTTSVVYGSSTTQTAAMVPNIQNGARLRFAELDAAAMKDIGWEVIPLPGINGDYNNNGTVDAADYVVWRDKQNQLVTIPNDPTPGSVTGSDYTFWRASFGRTQGSGSALELAVVPEAGGAVLVSIACMASGFSGGRRRHTTRHRFAV